MMNTPEAILRIERIFRQTAYLASGNARQRSAYQVLLHLDLFSVLSAYDPVLAGTIPLDIDIGSSDLDILCEVHDPDTFEAILIEHYSHMTDWMLNRCEVDGLMCTVVRWMYEEWEIEVFAQPRAVEQQNGFRHMVVEQRLLEHLGDQGRQQIRLRKQQGMKTEPAFADYLSIAGDPYKELLLLYEWSDEQLQQFIIQANLT